MVRTSNNLSATARARRRILIGSPASSSINLVACKYSASSKPRTSAPTYSRVIRTSESPTPALIIKGRPQPRYSAYFVGDEASFEKQGLINANPASLADRYEGTSLDADRSTV